MRKILFILLSVFSLTLCAKENASEILDKVSSTFKAAGNVKIGFNLQVPNGQTTGYIDISGNKFYCDMAGSNVWFDGTTMWHYVKANEEVNVTTPTASEVAKMNPYSFITLYKKGYKSRILKSTKDTYEIEMTGSNNSTYRSIIVHIKKSTMLPVYIKTTTARSTMEIKVNSFLKNQKFSGGSFTFNKKEFPKAEVIDLR